MQEVAAAARAARPELQTRPLRAVFIGALSGDVAMVEHAFFEVVKSLGGRAEGRVVRVYETREMGLADQQCLEGADMILIGGCVNLPPSYRDSYPEAAGAPSGPALGLHAMHAAGVFDSLRAARAGGAVLVGILEGALALGAGFVASPPAGTEAADNVSTKPATPRYFAARRPEHGSLFF